MKPHPMDISFFEEWLRDKKNLAESTVYLYIHSLERFLITNPEIDKVDDYNNFIIKFAIKKRCNHYYSVLKQYINFKITETTVRVKILDQLIKPPVKEDTVRERIHLTETKIFEVINNLERKKHRIIALIQSLTGVRAGDVLRLKDDGIVPEEYKNKSVLKLNIVGKRRKSNKIFIFDEVAQQVIMDYVTESECLDGYYFLQEGTMRNRGGDLSNEARMITMNYQWYWADLKQALQLAGVDKKDFATHDFRRCFARRAWEKHKDLYRLQSLLSHADPKTTLRYLKQSGLQNADYHMEMQE